MSKFLSRIILFALSLFAPILVFFSSRERRGVLVAHNFLLGDVFLLTPLLKALAEKYPDCPKYLLCRPNIIEAIRLNGFNFRVLAYDLRNPLAIIRMVRIMFGNVMTCYALGDNRYAVIGRAISAKRVVGEMPETKAWKKMFCTDFIPHLPVPNQTWADQVSTLIVPSSKKSCFSEDDWAGLRGADSKVSSPQVWDNNSDWHGAGPRNTVFIHVGASSSLRYWPGWNWRRVVEHLTNHVKADVFVSCGPGEEHLITEIGDGPHVFFSRGKYTLLETASALGRSVLVICLDSGIGHMAKALGVPSITLYGPGNPLQHGHGRYWEKVWHRVVWNPSFHCRDQRTNQGRPVSWLRRCSRTIKNCPTPGACMRDVHVEQVIKSVDEFFSEYSSDPPHHVI
jgi:ADP-heptose:LPS heptosyltransferase